jgi:hypothetical protein
MDVFQLQGLLGTPHWRWHGIMWSLSTMTWLMLIKNMAI